MCYCNLLSNLTPQFLVMKKLLCSLLVGICFSSVNAQSVTPIKNGGSKFSISCANLYFEVDSTRGARISSFKINEDELLYVDFQTTDMAGSTFWPSPQSVWNWPPAVNLDNRPYLSKIKGDTIIFKGATDSRSQLRFYKSMFASVADTSVSITYVIKNEKTTAQNWAPWEITRVPATGLTVFSRGSGSVTGDMASRTREINGFVWYDQDQYNAPGNKFFCDGQGWLAHATNEGYLFIKKFENIPASKKAPGEAEVEVYTTPNDSYTELENQGAYTSIASKDSIKWTVKWFARALPDGVDRTAGSKSLTDYIASILARDVPTSVTLPGNPSESVNVYPNPASGKLVMKSEFDSFRDVHFTIINLQGIAMFSQPVTNKYAEIDIQGLKPGIYLYQVKKANVPLAKGKFTVTR